MGFFDRFPYSNPYQLNLDWIIAQMKKFEADYNQLDPDSFLRKSGGVVGGVLQMGENGSINMNGNPLTGLKTAVNSGDALPFGQAEGLYLHKAGDKMSGNLDMDGHNIIGLAMPVGDADAATKQYVDLKIGTPEEPGAYLPLAGGMMSGDINMDGHGLSGIRNPINDLDAVNKQWAITSFAPKGYVKDTYSCISLDAVKNAILTEFAKLSDNKISFFKINVSGDVPVNEIARGNWQVSLHLEDGSSNGWGSFFMQKAGYMICGSIDDGVVSDFYWLNPPMTLGVEYRTAERYNGSPVYAKAITIAGINAGKTRYNNLISPVTKLVYSEFSVDSSGKNFIYKNDAFTYQIDNMGDTHALSLETKTELSGVSGVLTVKYIKD